MSNGRRICLFGDKQMKNLSKIMFDVGIEHFGGMVMNAKDIAAGNFHLDDSTFFSVDANTNSDDYVSWQETVNLIKTEKIKPLVITNFAVQSLENIDSMVNSISKVKDIDTATIFDYINFLKEHKKKQLSVIKRISRTGCIVTVLSDPPFFENADNLKKYSKYIYKYFNALEYLLGEYSVNFLNVAILFNNEINDQYSYRFKDSALDISDKAIYGNEKYYRWVVAKIMNDNVNKSYWINI